MVNELEVFGPVATVVPYRDKQDAFELARRGGGSLTASVFSNDTALFVGGGCCAGNNARPPVAGRSVDWGQAIRDMESCCTSLLHSGPERRQRRGVGPDCTGCGSIISA